MADIDGIGRDVANLSKVALHVLEGKSDWLEPGFTVDSWLKLGGGRPSSTFADTACNRLLGLTRLEAPAVNGQPQHRAWRTAKWVFDWVRGGMPRVRLSHKLAAALMATTIPEEFCSSIKLPWERFLLDVPDGLISRQGIGCTVMVQSLMGESSVEGEPGATIMFNSIAQSFTWVTAPWTEFTEPALKGRFDGTEVDDVQALRRCAEMLMKLIFGVTLELSSNAEVLRGKAAGERLMRDKRGEPKCWTVTLTRPIKADVRSAIAAYVRGNGQSLRVQGITVGHHKWQRHGPGNSLKKYIWVEPYWRGPDDAPIAVRSHVLRDRPEVGPGVADASLAPQPAGEETKTT